MKTTTLYLRTFILSLLVGVLLLVLQNFNMLGEYPSFAWTCWAFFALITPFVLGLAAMSNKSSTASKSVGIVLGAMGIKFVFCLIMILTYALIVRPTSSRFILPFFGFYIVYGIIETQFLMQIVQQAKNNQPTKKNY